MPQLIFQSEGKPVVYELPHDGLVTIGRHPDNIIVLDDESVSGHHAEIKSEDGGFTVCDLSSSNGSMVNGEVIDVRALSHTDSVRFGGVECVFENPPAQAVAEEPAPKKQQASFGSKLAGFGKAAVAEAQRQGQRANIRAQIEKLKLVDLNKAYYNLGKKAYELRIAQEKLSAEYDDIATTEKTIAAKRAGESAAHGASSMQRVKVAAMNSAMKAEAEGLELKLKQRFVALGQSVKTVIGQLEPMAETEDLRLVKLRITELEAEYAATSSDHSAQSEMMGLSASIAQEAGAIGKETWESGSAAIGRRISLKIGVLVLIGLLVAGGIVMTKRHTERQLQDTVDLAERYVKGEGAVQNLPEAVRLLREAAEKGHADAQFHLGSFYIHGLGIGKDEAVGASWFQKAANQDHALAQFNLASCYFDGTGVPSDKEKWLQLLQKAAKGRCALALYALGVAYQEGGGGLPIDEARAVDYFKKASDLKFPRALYDLGMCFKGGRGVPENRDRAKTYLKAAADLGDKDALAELEIAASEDTNVKSTATNKLSAVPSSTSGSSTQSGNAMDPYTLKKNRETIQMFKTLFKTAMDANPKNDHSANTLNMLVAVTETDWSRCSEDLRTAARELGVLIDKKVILPEELRPRVTKFMQTCENYEKL